MARINEHIKIKKSLTLFLVFVFTLLPLQTAGAQETQPDGLIPAGATLQGSQFIFAPQINIDGTVDGDVFAIGQDVNLTGEVKGSLYILSARSAIKGKVDGDLFTGTSRLSLEPTSDVGRSAYILGGIVSLLPESKIGRDLYLIGLSGEISGTVGRNQRAHLGTVEILEMLLGENGPLSPLLPKGFKLPWSAIDYRAAHPVQTAMHLFSAASGAGIAAISQPIRFLPLLQTTPIDSAAVGTWFVERLRSFAPLFLIGLLLLWLFPRFFQGSTERLRAHPVSSFGIGLVVFFVGFGVAFLALALFSALGLFFAILNYWDLAMLVWGAGLGGLSVGLAVFSLAVGYLSKIIVAYLIGAILLNRVPTTVWGRRVWMLLLGLLLLVLLLAIPFLGWVVSMVTIMFGLGAIYLQLRQRYQPVKEPVQTLASPSETGENAPPMRSSSEATENSEPAMSWPEETSAAPPSNEGEQQIGEEELAETGKNSG